MPEFSAADTQAPATASGPPRWLLIGGAVAAGLGLLVFLKGKSGGAGAAPAQTQTQESLATGDLAYQVQNGLGSLGVQAAKNQADLTNMFTSTNALIAGEGSAITGVSQAGTAQLAQQQQNYQEALVRWFQTYFGGVFSPEGGGLSAAQQALRANYGMPWGGYSVLGYRPPVVGMPPIGVDANGDALGFGAGR